MEPRSVSLPRPSGTLDAETIKKRLTENDVLAVYRAIGVSELRTAGDDFFKVIDGNKNPSRNINKRTGDWTDHRGGSYGDIFDAVKEARSCTFLDALAFVADIAGTTAAAMPAITAHANGKHAPITETYVYNNESGHPHMAVDRDAVKNFWQKRPDGHGGWAYGLGKGTDKVEPIPYHLDEFPTDRRKWLIHFEGEKDVDRARLHGLDATTSPGGSNGWKEELRAYYTGLNVAIVPDNDDPGWKYAETVAASLYGVANRVKVVKLPDLGERVAKSGKDISDWFDAGHTVIEFNELIKNSPDWIPTSDESEQPGEAPRPSRFTLLTPSELVNRPPPRWMIEGLLVEGTTSAVVGAPATLKSFLVQDWALCVAAGHPWHDRDVLHGPVIYISAEGSSGLPARLRAWEVHRGRSAPETCYFITEAVQFMEHGDVSELLLAIERLQTEPVFVIVDTLARTLVGGDENSSRDMGLFVSGLDAIRLKTGAHMLVVHHENKSGTTRGSTVLPGAIDTEINVKRDDDVVTITCAKQKDAAEFDKMTLMQRVIDLGDGRTSLILEPLELTSGTMSSIEQKVLHVLIDVFGTQGTTTTNWKKACEEAGGITHATFYRSRKNLVERALVATDDDQQRGAIFKPVQTEEEYQNAFL